MKGIYNSLFGIGTSAFSTYENSFSRPRTSQTSSRIVFQPTLGATKPIYPYSLPHPPQTPSKSRAHSSRSRRMFITPLTAEKRARLLLSDLSNEDNPPNTASPSPPMIRIERDTPSRKQSTPSPTRIRPPSIIKLNPPTPPRPHSVIDLKFICICDEEHRIECWYHQYPFIHSHDLLNLFQSKSTTISAFFTDDLPAKTILQGKPFHIHQDWKKYDLIFISNTISERILPYLQNILSQNKSIRISQLTHEENLKKQVKTLCKLFQQNL